MHLKLICSMREPAAGVIDDPANEGFELSSILDLLHRTETCGHSIAVVAVETLSAEERHSLYFDAVAATQRAGARYRIREVFGSRRRGGGPFFGSGIPALLAEEEGSTVDVYPHQDARTTVTIRNYLEGMAGIPKPLAPGALGDSGREPYRREDT